MSASKERVLRLILFTSIYFVEGAVLTYSSSFNILYLRSFDISYTMIGLVSAISLIPFVLKIFIGYLSDKVSLFNKGHRKPYIMIGLVLQTLRSSLYKIPSRSAVSHLSGHDHFNGPGYVHL